MNNPIFSCLVKVIRSGNSNDRSHTSKWDIVVFIVVSFTQQGIY